MMEKMKTTAPVSSYMKMIKKENYDRNRKTTDY